MPPREVRGMETAAARPGPWGTVAGPRGVLRGGGGGGEASLQVSGRCSVATEVGPRASPARGEGAVDVRVKVSSRREQVAAFRALGEALPVPLGNSLPASSAPRLAPRKLGAPQGFLVSRRGEAGW